MNKYDRISTLELLFLFGFGVLFAILAGSDPQTRSIVQIIGGAAWGIFLAYVFLAAVRRGSGKSYWDRPSYIHLGVNLALSSIGAFGLVFGGGFAANVGNGLAVAVLVVLAALFSGFFRLIVKLSKKLSG